MNNYEYANATDDELLSWDISAYEERREAELWEAECRQIGWAEAGGYKAGLARPSFGGAA